jgi:adenylate cyclase class 2
MNTEIEAKWLRVDIDAMRARLIKAGARLVQTERLMSRKTYDYPDRRLNKIHAWVRIRDEGDKVTMSFKQLQERTLLGTKEVNLTIDSLDEAHVFLTSLGLEQKSAQDTKRESWNLNGCEVELDTWPWIPSFIEIEGHSEAAVLETAKKLGLDIGKALYGGVEPAYQDVYAITDKEIDSINSITFDEPVPDWIENRRL